MDDAVWIDCRMAARLRQNSKMTLTLSAYGDLYGKPRRCLTYPISLPIVTVSHVRDGSDDSVAKRFGPFFRPKPAFPFKRKTF